MSDDPLWYQDAVFYELHVKAFQDSNGDGIGDFNGLIQRLDYVQELGVDVIWLLPYYPSPLRDDGYDIADYWNIHPSYGTVEDFTRFMDEAHRRGLKVISDLVLNHTSSDHPWFQRARRAPKGSPERDWYVWSDRDDAYRDARIIFSRRSESGPCGARSRITAGRHAGRGLRSRSSGVMKNGRLALLLLGVGLSPVACAGSGTPRTPLHLEPVPEVLRVEVSGVAEARTWVVRGQPEWSALWERIPATEVGSRSLPAVDFTRDIIVVMAAGTGHSGSPALSFDGFTTRGDTVDVHIREAWCAGADDVTQLLIAGRIPRRTGPVQVIRHRSTGCG